MKLYYYFLFRIYMFYKDTMKETANFTISASLVSGLLIVINIIAVYAYLSAFDLVPSFFDAKFEVILMCAIVWVINYYLFVKNEKFLTYNFKKDKKGGVLVVMVIIFTALVLIHAANLNREKIFRGRAERKRLENLSINFTPTSIALQYHPSCYPSQNKPAG
jgi:hypothetical protein